MRSTTRLRGQEAAEAALHYVAPVGEKEEYVARAWRNISPYLPAAGIMAASGRALPRGIFRSGKGFSS